VLEVALATLFVTIALLAVGQRASVTEASPVLDVWQPADDGQVDLPCPWCSAQTHEDDRQCPSCGQLFG